MYKVDKGYAPTQFLEELDIRVLVFLFDFVSSVEYVRDVIISTYY